MAKSEDCAERQGYQAVGFMGQLLEACAHLDLIDRVDELVGDIAHIPRGFVRISVLREEHRPPIEAERTLARYGVPLWGRGFSGGGFYFTVPKQQAAWAEYLLRRGQWAVLTVVDARNQGWAARHEGLPPAWADAPRLLCKPDQPAQKRHKKRKPSRAVSAGKGIAQALRRAVKAVAGEQ